MNWFPVILSLLSPEPGPARGVSLTQRVADATGEGFARVGVAAAAYAFIAMNVLVGYAALVVLLALWAGREWGELAALGIIAGLALTSAGVVLLLLRMMIGRREEEARLDREAASLRAEAAELRRAAEAARAAAEGAASGAAVSLRNQVARIVLGAAAALNAARTRGETGTPPAAGPAGTSGAVNGAYRDRSRV